MKREMPADIDQLLTLARAYPTSHIYTGGTDGSRVYRLSIGVPHTADLEFLKLVVKGDVGSVTYRAHHVRAGQTFGEDLRAGMLAGLLEDLAHQLRRHHLRRQEREVISSMVEASGHGTAAGATIEFCNAGHRILRSRTN